MLNAKLQKKLVKEIGYAVKHNRLPRNLLLISRCNMVLPEGGIEGGGHKICRSCKLITNVDTNTAS